MTKGRWRKLGPGGVLERSITCSDWAAQLLRLPPAAPSDDEPRNHNMTEASLEIGRLAFHAVFLACAGQLRLDLPTPGRLAPLNMALPRPTAAPMLAAAGPSPADPDLRVGALEKNAAESAGPLRLEPRRSQTLVRQASRAALVAFSICLCVFGGTMAAAGAEPGTEWMLGGPGRCFAGPPFMDDLFRNRVGLNVEGPVLTGMLAARRLPGRTQQLKTGRPKGRSRNSNEGGRPVKSGQVVAGATRGPTNLEGGLDNIGGAAPCGGLRERHNQDTPGRPSLATSFGTMSPGPGQGHMATASNASTLSPESLQAGLMQAVDQRDSKNLGRGTRQCSHKCCTTSCRCSRWPLRR